MMRRAGTLARDDTDIPRSVRFAFTLIEILVSIAVIALLLAILIPILARGRESASATKSLANLRSIDGGFDSYRTAYREFYPYPTPDMPYQHACDAATISFGHWLTHTSWPWIVQPVMPWKEWSGVMLAPGALKKRAASSCGDPTSYRYSSTFTARPEMWSPTSTASPESLFAGTKHHDVLFPSQKALMWDWEMPYISRQKRFEGDDLAEKTPMLFSDSHAELRSPAAASAAAVNRSMPGTDPLRLRDTLDGVRGRDY
jgi:prepilin-type N-terminal cleavage/methylation domain-containing protein